MTDEPSHPPKPSPEPPLSPALLASYRLPALLIAPDGTLKACNRAAAEANAQTAEGLAGCHAAELFKGGKKRSFRNRLDTARSDGEAGFTAPFKAANPDAPFDFRLVRVGNGTAGWVLMVAESAASDAQPTDEGGIVTGLCPNLMDALPYGVLVFEGQRLDYANPAAASLLERDDPEAMQGLLVASVVYAEDREHMGELLDKAAETGRADGRLRLLDGDDRPVEMATSLALLGEGPRPKLQLVFHPTTRQRGLERALRESEERYRHLIGNLGEGFWMGGNNGGTADVNQALLDLLGYSREAMLDHPLTEFAEASERDRLRRCLNDLEEGEASTFETTLIRQDGRPLPVTVRMVALPDPSTGLPALLAFITDLSAQQTLRDRLRRETGLNEAILGSLPGIFFLVGPGLALTRWNSNLCHQTGLAALELAGLPAPELFDAPDREAVRTLLDGAQAEGGGEMEAHLVAGDDRRIPFRLSAAPISLGESGFLAVLGVDITERKALEADLERMATVDGLTGAWNRAAMERQLVTEIERSRRYGNRLSLLLLDLDRFGTVNDHFGREIGDQVLRDVVASIQANKRATDFLGRWGGDQFLLLAPDTNLTGATTLAENLHVLIGSQDFDPVALIQCSTGVTAYHPGDSLTHLLERLDGILHEAKRRGRNQVMVAEP